MPLLACSLLVYKIELLGLGCCLGDGASPLGKNLEE